MSHAPHVWLIAAGLLASAPALACPVAVLGADTSRAVLTDVEYQEVDRHYLLTLHLKVIDQPEFRKIEVEGQPVRAHIEHFTPMTLAHWTKYVTLLFGGTSKWVVGAVTDPASGELALLPYASVKGLRIEQGDDLDANAPYQVELQLLLLHSLEPWEGERQPFTPYEGVGRIGDSWIELAPNPDPARFDFYGQSTGDWFAYDEYVFSFVHGPWDVESFRSSDHPKPWTENASSLGAEGFRAHFNALPPGSPGATPPLPPAPDLHTFVKRTYDELAPDTTLRALMGHEVQVVLAGDRSPYPPTSPYSHYHQECAFFPDRMEGAAPNDALRNIAASRGSPSSQPIAPSPPPPRAGPDGSPPWDKPMRGGVQGQPMHQDNGPHQPRPTFWPMISALLALALAFSLGALWKRRG